MVAVETPERAASEAGSMVMKYSDLLFRDDAYSRAIGRNAQGASGRSAGGRSAQDAAWADHTRLFRRLVRRAGQDGLGVHRQFAKRLIQGVPFRLRQASREGRLDVARLGNEAGI